VKRSLLLISCLALILAVSLVASAEEMGIWLTPTIRVVFAADADERSEYECQFDSDGKLTAVIGVVLYLNPRKSYKIYGEDFLWGPENTLKDKNKLVVMQSDTGQLVNKVDEERKYLDLMLSEAENFSVRQPKLGVLGPPAYTEGEKKMFVTLRIEWKLPF